MPGSSPAAGSGSKSGDRGGGHRAGRAGWQECGGTCGDRRRCGFQAARAGLKAGSAGPSGRRGGRSTGHRLGRGVAPGWSPRACGAGSPLRGLRSLHLLGEDVSQPMAGPGAPVAASPGGASPAGLSRRPPYAGARARRHRLPGTRRALRRSFPGAHRPRTAAPAGAHRPRPPPAGARSGGERRGEPEAPRSERRSGVGAASTARAPVAAGAWRARAGGRGGAHVRVFAGSRPGGRAPGSRSR